MQNITPDMVHNAVRYASRQPGDVNVHIARYLNAELTGPANRDYLLPTWLDKRTPGEIVYLDEIDRRFSAFVRVRVPQLASDVHGVTTLDHLAGLLAAEKAFAS